MPQSSWPLSTPGTSRRRSETALTIRSPFPPGTDRRTKRAALLLAVVVAVAVIVVASMVGQSVVSGGDPVEPPVQRPPAAALRPTQFVREVIAPAEVSVAYPRDWTKRRQARDPEVKLVVARDRSASLLVRVTATGLDVTSDTLELVRPLTDSLVNADRRVELLEQPTQVLVGGLPGYRYRYRFVTTDGTPGVHDHYFLFKQGQMVTLVFQALPASRAPELSGLFDEMVQMFRGQP